MSFYCNGMKGICTEMKTARYCPMDCKFSDGTGGHHVETNGDRIRAMSDEELAEFIVGNADEDEYASNEEGFELVNSRYFPVGYEHRGETATENVLYWLKQPVR